MEDAYHVFWKGTEIGIFSDVITDMWYLEGVWMPNSSNEATVFEALVSKFNASEVMQNPMKSTRLALNSTFSKKTINAFVIAIIENKLIIRMVSDDEATKWLVKNVN